MGPIIKVVALFLVVVLMIGHSAMAQAAPLGGCAQVAQSLRNLAANIAGDADLYFGHRKKFVTVAFRRAKDASVQAKATREAEKKNAIAEAGNVKHRMPTSFASFKAAVQTARAQKCLPAADLQAIVEKTTDLARNVNFDQFPREEMEGDR